MGSGSSKKKEPQQVGPETGFSARDVKSFKASGSRLASNTDKKIRKPKEYRSVEQNLDGETVSTLSISDISDISTEQLDALVATFKRRKEEITSRRLSPGPRAQTFATV